MDSLFTVLLMIHKSTFLLKRILQTLKVLRDCLHDIKSWLALNVLNVNNQKAEIVLCGPSDPHSSLKGDLDPLGKSRTAFAKIWECYLMTGSYWETAVKGFEWVANASNWSRPGSSSALSSSALACLRVLLTGRRKRDRISPSRLVYVLASSTL